MTEPTAAELIAVAVRARLLRRLAWLAIGDSDDATAETAWQATQPPGEDAAALALLAGDAGATWTRLVTRFALAPAEQALLQLAVAVGVEPALGPLVAAAQGSTRALPGEALARRLHGLPARPIWRPTGALAMWALVRAGREAPGAALEFEADPRIIDWLFGAVSLDQALVLGVEPLAAGDVPGDWPVATNADRLARAAGGGAVRLVVEARAGSGRRQFAAAVAQALGRSALAVDPAALAGSDWAENFMRLQRFALYADVALVWRSGAPDWPGKIALAPLQCVCVDDGAAPPARDGITDIVVRLPEPGIAAKAALWRQLAPQLADADAAIASIPGLAFGDLAHAARALPESVGEATAHLRALARSRMQGVGRVVDPIYDWDDLVLDESVTAQLRRLAFEARSRAKLLADPDSARQFAGAAALTALFAGPPGVGKSMAAQVIARDLGVNLLVVDLAATTSKYIGETAKNLSLAFARARAAGAALIFEEADALFARRTDVKDSTDRHANADTGHLLQLMEAHDGIVILSTNRRANLDPAFTRRIRHHIEFPRPRAAERARVWTLAIAALGLDMPEPAAIAMLAERHDLSPAQIKSAVLSAAYAALADGRKPDFADFDQGAGAELVKEGRSPPPPAVTPIRRTRSALRG